MITRPPKTPKVTIPSNLLTGVGTPDVSPAAPAADPSIPAGTISGQPVVPKSPRTAGIDAQS